MPNIMQRIFLGIIVVALAGCGVSARSYVQVKERIDQEPAGNAGYFTGGPKEGEAQPDRHKTRRVYVMEFSKENAIQVEEPLAASTTTRTVETYTPPTPEPEPAPRRRIELPSFDDGDSGASDTSEPSGPSEAVEYTIEKNDTMQKISKKFYDSYSKWPKIYEANKDRIPDPNRIKPGTTITIPPLE